MAPVEILGVELAAKLGGKRYYDSIEAAKERAKNDTRTPAERRRDILNADTGTYPAEEYDCKVCKNRGYTASVIQLNGMDYVISPECKCMEIRRALWRMRKSGLEKVIRKYTFDTFNAREKWQQKILQMARDYAGQGAESGQWFFIGGQPGCGKTHICTAIVREILYRKAVIYMPWESESKALKAKINEAAEYEEAVKVYKNIPVLYIDDLFKPTRDSYGNQPKPTAADVKLAFEILNHRYIHTRPTIISTEWTLEALIDIDEATASRIAERCGQYKIVIAKDRAKNHRFSFSS